MKEEVEIDLPDYDTRQLLAARDPLACVYAFDVLTRVVLPSLYGFRMCPECPHCCDDAHPCMDIFGSNATPMGGAAGRGDAMVGAVEAQKAEGVLHVHLFLFLQMLIQFVNLCEVADRLREGLLSPEAIKRYVSYVRCASYPNHAQFLSERDAIEKHWPAFVDEDSLCCLPAHLWEQLLTGPAEHRSGSTPATADGQTTASDGHPGYASGEIWRGR